MLIANPRYDAVFKFFMEDPEVAKRLISNIIGQEVVSLTPQPQETITQSKKYALTILRLDYKAVIVNAEGETKKVLIELQKAENLLDIQRFRRYLGENYAKTDAIEGNSDASLPILCIYFLGFELDHLRKPYPIIKSTPLLIDVANNQPLEEQEEAHKNEFIQLLTHTSYFIQMQHLPFESPNLLLHRLSPFAQTKRMLLSTEWKKDYPELKHISDNDLQLFVARLWLAVQDQAVQEDVRAEQEIDRKLDAMERVIEAANQKAAQAEAEKQQAEAEKQQAEERLKISIRALAQTGMSVTAIASLLSIPEVIVSEALS